MHFAHTANHRLHYTNAKYSTQKMKPRSTKLGNEGPCAEGAHYINGKWRSYTHPSLLTCPVSHIQRNFSQLTKGKQRSCTISWYNGLSWLQYIGTVCQDNYKNLFALPFSVLTSLLNKCSTFYLLFAQWPFIFIICYIGHCNFKYCFHI